MIKCCNDNFWNLMDVLIIQSKIIIDRPKGSSAHPLYPQIVYELDYGYLDGTKSSDNEGIVSLRQSTII